MEGGFGTVDWYDVCVFDLVGLWYTPVVPVAGVAVGVLSCPEINYWPSALRDSLAHHTTYTRVPFYASERTTMCAHPPLTTLD